jgi:hypothetical protein
MRLQKDLHHTAKQVFLFHRGIMRRSRQGHAFRITLSNLTMAIE